MSPSRAASVDVTVEGIVRCPPEVVAAYANNPSNATEWYANIKDVRWKTSPPVSVGSEIEFVAKFLGRQLVYTYEVIELSEASFVMRTAEGPFPMETTYRYSSTAEGHTRMTLRNRGTPTGFSRLVAPILKVAMRSANRKDLKALRRRLEGDDAAG